HQCSTYQLAAFRSEGNEGAASRLELPRQAARLSIPEPHAATIPMTGSDPSAIGAGSDARAVLRAGELRIIRARPATTDGSEMTRGKDLVRAVQGSAHIHLRRPQRRPRRFRRSDFDRAGSPRDGPP